MLNYVLRLVMKITSKETLKVKVSFSGSADGKDDLVTHSRTLGYSKHKLELNQETQPVQQCYQCQ